MTHSRLPAPLLAFVIAVSCLPGPALAAADDDLSTFAGHLRACTPATATQPHPLMGGFTIEHSVVGMRDDACEYGQSIPGGMHMHCRFDEGTRNAYADELQRAATTGSMSGSSNGPQPEWTTACEIETKDGKRLPMDND